MDDARSLLPPTDIGRRGFVASSLAVSGFALAAQPVQAQTIVTTSADGLEAGDISIPTSTGPIAGYRAAPTSPSWASLASARAVASPGCTPPIIRR